MSFDYTRQTVLITGASSGIGAEFATALAQRGAAVVLVARRKDRLEALAEKLRAEFGATAYVVSADLSSPSAAEDLKGRLASQGIGVTSLINNAGFGSFGPFSAETADGLAREIAVDVATPVQVTAALLPDLIAAGHGFLINVASMAAYTPTPRMAVYGASKAFVLSFSESLWAELRGTGVVAFALSPGATATEFNSVVGSDDATAGVSPRTPADVVNTALRHLERRSPGPSVIDGTVNRLAASMSRFVSRRAVVRLMDRMTDPARRTSAATALST